METETEVVKTILPNGSILHIRATSLHENTEDYERKVAYKPQMLSFESVTETLQGIAEAVVSKLQRVKPNKATVELGLEIAIEQGQLTAILVKGAATAHLNITLEWNGSVAEDASS